MADIRTPEGRKRQATENTERDIATAEQQARAVARVLGADEEQWRDQLPVVIAVEEGRLMAVHLEHQTPEWQEGFRNYMMNR